MGDDFRIGQGLDEDRKDAVSAGIGFGDDPLGNFFLDRDAHEFRRVGQIQGLDHDGAGHVVRKVGDEGPIFGELFQDAGVEAASGEDIALEEFEGGWELTAEEFAETPVEFDGEDFFRGRDEEFGEISGARPDFQNKINIL
jgi:hypothetical protein